MPAENGQSHRPAAARRSAARPSLPIVIGLAAAVTLATAGQAGASGYALREQSVTALGNAFSGATAGGDDVSYMFFNPATLSLQHGNQMILGGTVVAPQIKIRNAQASNSNGIAYNGNGGGRDAGEDHFVPYFYAMWDVQQSLGLTENIKAGLSVNVPFGVETDYRDNWLGRYYALHSKVQAVSASPVVAWEVTDGLSLAAGPQIQYFQAKLSNAIDFGSIGPGGVPGEQDGIGKVDGSDVGYGYVLGALWEPRKDTRIGLAYHSAVEHTLRGDGTFALGGPRGETIAGSTGAFQDTNARADITTPETASLGVYHALSPDWAIMGDVEWTRWSRFKNLTVEYSNPQQPNAVTPEDWNDTWFVSLGTTWKPVDAWTLRFGAAFDQDPIPKSTRTPRIPTADRYWISFGAAWLPLPDVSFDLGYTHIFIVGASLDLSDTPGNTPHGNFSGNAESSVDMLGVQFRVNF
ncbi:MAG: transporter [Rhodospirillales bacterium]|nr:transporter [Rhodospirillales bacterium]